MPKIQIPLLDYSNCWIYSNCWPNKEQISIEHYAKRTCAIGILADVEGQVIRMSCVIPAIGYPTVVRNAEQKIASVGIMFAKNSGPMSSKLKI